MLLERVEIVGFRGINRLSLQLEQNNVLIGENAWGKSSLLDALTLLLSPEDDLYHFVRDDFWFPPGDVTGREKHLHIILTFRESEPGRHRVRRFRPLSPCWVPCDDGFHRIFYRLEGEMAENEGVLTLRDFLDEKASPIPLDNIDDLARHLIRLTPVLRLRDARFMRRIRNGTVPNMPEVEVTARELDFLARELVSRPQNLTDGQIRQGLSAMVQLLEHYFSEQGTSESRHRLMRRRSHDEQRSWRYLDIINRMIDRPGGRTHRVILLGLFSTLLQAKGTVRLDRDARPLLLVEKKFIIKAAKQWELPLWANACPSAGNTARSDMGETLKALYGVAKDSRRCILNGLSRWQLEKNSLPDVTDAGEQESGAFVRGEGTPFNQRPKGVPSPQAPHPPPNALHQGKRAVRERDTTGINNAMAAAVAGQGQPRFKEEEYDGLFVYRSGLCAGFRPVGAGHRPHLLRHRSP